VSNFDLLHPALQHHIVNSLGWRELRPFQETVIPQLLAGQHLLILAPTAGGKTEVKGRSRWKGEGQDLGFRLCQAIRNVLGADDNREWWSHRARQQISEVRQEFAWLDDDGTAVVRSESAEAVWWTFAGVKANATLACELSRTVKNRVTYDSFTVTFEPHLSFDVIGQALDELRARDARKMRPAVEEQAIDGLKFSECLPHNLAVHILEARLCDPAAVKGAFHKPTRFIVS
jgi:ATP-dependent helicase Lhr and Lhr-like helicase